MGRARIFVSLSSMLKKKMKILDRKNREKTKSTNPKHKQPNQNQTTKKQLDEMCVFLLILFQTIFSEMHNKLKNSEKASVIRG